MKVDCIYKDGNEIWFVDRNDNLLCNVDKVSEKVIYHGMIPCIGKTYRMHPYCIKYDNVVICIPDNARSFVVYDTVKKEFMSYAIDAIEIAGVNRLTLCNYWQVEGVLWTVSYRGNIIISFDLQSKEINYFWINEDKKPGNAGFGACLYGDDIYITNRNSHIISVFNVKSKEFRRYEVKSEELGYNTVSVYDDSKLILSGFSGKIYQYGMRENKTDVITLEKKKFILCDENNSIIEGFCKSPVFRKSICTGKYIVFIPWFMPDSMANSLVVYSIDENKVRYYCILGEIFDKNIEQKGKYFSYIYIQDEENVVFYMDDEEIKVMNLSTGAINEKYFEYTVNIAENFFETAGTLNESREIGLQNYIKYILKDRERK